MKAQDSIKGMAKLAEIKKDAKEFVKLARVINTDFARTGLEDDKPMEEFDIAASKEAYPEWFEAKNSNTKDVFMLLSVNDVYHREQGKRMEPIKHLEKDSKVFQIMKKYGLAKKHYHIEHATLSLQFDKNNNAKIEYYVFIRFPHNKIPSQTFWQAVQFESTAYENQRKAKEIYQQIAAKSSTNKR